MMNGYSSQLLEHRVKSFIDKIYNENRCNTEHNEIYGPEQFKVYIQLPYIGDTSNKIRKCLNSCLNKIKCGTIKIVFTSSFSRLKDVFKFKDKQPAHCKSNVIYLITCSCKRKYVDKT